MSLSHRFSQLYHIELKFGGKVQQYHRKFKVMIKLRKRKQILMKWLDTLITDPDFLPKTYTHIKLEAALNGTASLRLQLVWLRFSVGGNSMRVTLPNILILLNGCMRCIHIV